MPTACAYSSLNHKNTFTVISTIFLQEMSLLKYFQKVGPSQLGEQLIGHGESNVRHLDEGGCLKGKKSGWVERVSCEGVSG